MAMGLTTDNGSGRKKGNKDWTAGGTGLTGDNKQIGISNFEISKMKIQTTTVMAKILIYGHKRSVYGRIFQR